MLRFTHLQMNFELVIRSSWRKLLTFQSIRRDVPIEMHPSFAHTMVTLVNLDDECEQLV